jgi:probable rRNA maturation factor
LRKGEIFIDTVIINQQNKVNYTENHEKLIKKVFKNISQSLEMPENTEVSILLVDNNYIQELNLLYRGQNRPTDVLSFAMNELGEDEPDFDIDEEVNLLGDIVISLEKAIAQSEEYGHSFEREFVFLAVHGMLHLLGYDHEDADEQKVMREMEDRIMKSVNLEG